MTRLCWCGHDETAHQHWRPGADCGRCGRARCRAYRPRRFEGLRDVAAWTVVRWRTRRWWRQVRRDDTYLDRLADGAPAPPDDELACYLAAWRDEARRDEEPDDS